MNPNLIKAAAIGAAAAAALYLGVSLSAGWNGVAAAFGEVGWLTFDAALALSLGNYFLRLARWRMYLRALGAPLDWATAEAIYLAGFALTATPAKAGELLRAFFAMREGVPPRVAASAFLSERLSDLIGVVLIALPGAAAFAHGGFVVAIGCGAVAALGLAPSLVWGKSPGADAAVAEVVDPTEAEVADLGGPFWKTRPTRGARTPAEVADPGRGPLAGPPPRNFSERFALAKRARQLADLVVATRRCHRPEILVRATALSLAAWGCEGFAFHLVLARLGFPLGLGAAMSIYALAMLAGAVSFLPGGIGGAEAVMTALLMASGAPEAKSVAATVVIRLATLWFAVAIGLAALAIERRRFWPAAA